MCYHANKKYEVWSSHVYLFLLLFLCVISTAAMSKSLQAHYPPDTVEAITLENGIILAHEMNISGVIFESDSLSIVQSV